MAGLSLVAGAAGGDADALVAQLTHQILAGIARQRQAQDVRCVGECPAPARWGWTKAAPEHSPAWRGYERGSPPADRRAVRRLWQTRRSGRWLLCPSAGPVPGRRRSSGIILLCSAGAIYSAPTPLGPPILWALREMRSAPSSCACSGTFKRPAPHRCAAAPGSFGL